VASSNRLANQFVRRLSSIPHALAFDIDSGVTVCGKPLSFRLSFGAESGPLVEVVLRDARVVSD